MINELFSSIYGEEVYDVPAPVTIVLGQPWKELKLEERQLLTKILLAVKQPIDGVRILSQTKLDLSEWSAKPSRVIAFVPPAKGVGLYEVIRTGFSSIVFSESPDALIAKEAAKKKLWQALQTLFPS
jgi:hypothetical protein